MKLFEITEQHDIDSFVEIVARDCEPFLNAKNPGQVLYRGMYNLSNKSHNFIKYNLIVRKNRKPSDTPENISDKLDVYLYKKFGHRFRSAALFATGKYSKSLERMYGTAYMVYPVGNINFAWSPETADVYYTLSTLARSQYGFEFSDMKRGRIELDDEKVQEFLKNSNEIFDDLNYQSTDLVAAIRSGHEIMIDCDTYHAIRKKDIDSPGRIDREIYKELKGKSSEII